MSGPRSDRPSGSTPAPAAGRPSAGLLRTLLSRAPPSVGPVARYASAPAAVIFTTLVQYLALPDPVIAPFVFFFFGIALVAWIAGRGPGLVAVLLAAVVANRLFLEPRGRIVLAGPQLTATLLFIVGAGAVAVLCAMFRDTLLEAQRVAARLRESEEQLRLAKDAAGMGAWSWDPATGELAWSPRGRELFGIAPDVRVTYDAFLQTLHAEDRDRVDRAMKDALARDGDLDVETRVPWPDGTVHWVATRGRGLRAAGQPIRMAGMAMDVTGRKRVEEALRVANERLEAADRRKNDFLGVLSHELRNPLSPIHNGLYVVRRTAPGSEQARRALAVVDRQLHQLTRLVDDLLDVARIARGKIRLERERVHLQALARQTAEDHRDLFERSGLELEVRLADEPLWVNADPTRLKQVIGNLLHNAVKFTPPGARTIVSIRRIDEGGAEISVQDTGPGIEPEVLATLFEPFVQAEATPARGPGGLGLGLALVKGLVELHGGDIRAHSPGRGHGATFVVRIPAERGAPSFPEPGAAPRETGAPARRILVIEDDVDAAETLKDALELNEHAVELAYDGSDGLRRVRAFKPDVVICDIGLPGMTGLEVARAIRTEPDLRSVILVALSGFALPDDVDQAKAAGFDLHVAKPPDLPALERAIAEAGARGRPA